MESNTTQNPGQNPFVRFADQFTVEPIRSARLDLTGMARGIRVLAWGGYIFCALLILFTFVLEWINPIVPPAQYTTNEITRQIPLLAAIVTWLGLPLAWAMILTGACLAGRAVSIAGLAIQLAYATLFAASGDIFFACTFLPLYALVLIGMSFAIRRWQLTTRAPLAVFFAFYLVIQFYFALAGTSSENAVELARTENLLRWQNLLLAWPLWLLSGLSLVNFSIALAQGIIKRARPAFDDASFARFAQWVLAGQVLLNAVLLGVTLLFSDGRAFLPLSLALSIVCCAFMLWFQVKRQWNARRAAVLLSLTIVWFVLYTIFVGLFFAGVNLTEPVNSAVDRFRLLPPGAFFMFTLTITILGLLIPFTQHESARLPRTARILMALGIAMLFLVMMLFFLFSVNAADGSNYATDFVFTALFVLGAIFIGLPYLIWVLWKKQAYIIGATDEWEHFARTENANARNAFARVFVALLPVWFFVIGTLIRVLGLQTVLGK